MVFPSPLPSSTLIGASTAKYRTNFGLDVLARINAANVWGFALIRYALAAISRAARGFVDRFVVDVAASCRDSAIFACSSAWRFWVSAKNESTRAATSNSESVAMAPRAHRIVRLCSR